MVMSDLEWEKIKRERHEAGRKRGRTLVISNTDTGEIYLKVKPILGIIIIALSAGLGLMCKVLVDASR